MFLFLQIVRSIIFNIVFFTTLFVFMIFGVFFIPLNQERVFRFWHFFSVAIDTLIQKLAGIKYTVEGRENMRKTAIYAVRHESTWETLVFVRFFNKPIFLIKKELAAIPIFGILAQKSGAIPIDRENGVSTLMNTMKEVKSDILKGHPIVMFPEGTRVNPGEHAELKRGIALFYAQTNCSVIPVVHNSGTFWSRRSFIKIPGNIGVKFLQPIEPGLSKDEFMKKLEETFRNAVDDLNENSKNGASS